MCRAGFVGAVWVAAVWLAMACLSPRAFGQTDADGAIEELRVRIPSGANDERIIDNWLEVRIGQLSDAADPAVGTSAFVAALRQVRDAPDSTAEFRAALAQGLARAAAAAFGRGEALKPHVGDTLVRALIEVPDKQALAGLTAGLTFPRPEIRYLAAKGLMQLRDALSPNERRGVLDALKEAGKNETNGVVVERIYRAMSFRDPPVELFDAAAEVLAARVERYRGGRFLSDTAETAILEYLSRVQVPQASQVKLVTPLATLLRLDVEQYAQEGLTAEGRVAIELRVDACESLLSRLTGAEPAETVRGAMQSGGPAVVPTMQLALIGWIGGPQTAGALNAAPWNVPRGAP